MGSAARAARSTAAAPRSAGTAARRCSRRRGRGLDSSPPRAERRYVRFGGPRGCRRTARGRNISPWGQGAASVARGGGLRRGGGSATPAGAVTFGANSGRRRTNAVTCGQGVLEPFSLLPGCESSSWAPGHRHPYAAATWDGDRGAGPGRRRDRPDAGVVMRSLYQNKAGDPGHPYFACCFVERYGPVVHAAANTVTSEPADLPMTEEPVPPPEDFTTNAAGDFLALSVLSPCPDPCVRRHSSGDSGFYPPPPKPARPRRAQPSLPVDRLRG